MKTTIRPSRLLILPFLAALSTFAVKAQSPQQLWLPDQQHVGTFSNISQGHTSAAFVHAQTAEAEAVYHFERMALAFDFVIEDEDFAEPVDYLMDAVIESGHVHLMPVGKVVEGIHFSYCDYEGHIGNERFGMRQYLYFKGQEVCLLRILHKPGVAMQPAFAAAEAQLLTEQAPLAKT